MIYSHPPTLSFPHYYLNSNCFAPHADHLLLHPLPTKFSCFHLLNYLHKFIMGNLDAPLLNSSEVDFRPLDPEEFRKQAHQTVDFIADYYKNIESYPVLSRVEPGYLRARLPAAAPREPETLETILKDVRNDIIPGMTNWLSPNFFAYFPATVSTAAFVGEMLCTSFNSVGFNWLASPAATELETIVMDWLAKLLKLPV